MKVAGAWAQSVDQLSSGRPLFRNDLSLRKPLISLPLSVRL